MAPKNPAGAWAPVHPTGAHGLVAGPYQPLADSRMGCGPTKPRLLQSLQKANQNRHGFDLASGTALELSLIHISEPTRPY